MGTASRAISVFTLTTSRDSATISSVVTPKTTVLATSGSSTTCPKP